MKVKVRLYSTDNETLCTSVRARHDHEFFSMLSEAYGDPTVSVVGVSVECEECAHILSEFDIDLELLRGAFTNERAPSTREPRGQAR